MGRYTYDLLIETQAKEDLGNVGSQGDDLLRRKEDDHFPSYFVLESL
jgi:hypothetical protein